MNLAHRGIFWVVKWHHAVQPELVTAMLVLLVAILLFHLCSVQADVIVNSTSNGLDLHNGAVSSSMLREAGPGLQDECHQKYPKGIQSGEIAQTSGHGLQCNQVYHVALCNWSNPNAEQVRMN